VFYIGDPGYNAGIINLNFGVLHIFSRVGRIACRLSLSWNGRSDAAPHFRCACHVIFIIAMP